MAVIRGTSGKDVIDTTKLTGVTSDDQVDAGHGDDMVTLVSFLIYVSGPGNDIIRAAPGSTWVSWAAWGAPKPVVVNLAEGWAEDGYGGTDLIEGISTVHLPNSGGKVIGTSADETVFCFGGSGVIDLGGGRDVVEMYSVSSAGYKIRQSGSTVELTRNGGTIQLKNVEEIRFSDATIKPTYVANESLLFVKTLSSFVESEKSNGWWYAGVYNPPTLVGYFPQAASPFDLDADGYIDFVVPMNRGYRTGVDSRYSFQVFHNNNGELTFDANLTQSAPFVAGARRTEIINLVRYGTKAQVTIAHDTAIETEQRFDIPWRFGDITFTLAKPFGEVGKALIPDGLSNASKATGRKSAVDAHSMAVGDLNGDGMEDVLVGDFSGVFALLQTREGPFVRTTNALFDALNGWRDPGLPNSTPSLLIDLALADLNSDGAVDLVAGWGHGTVQSRVFFNDRKGGFSINDSVTLPPPVYGVTNSLHMRTLIQDFDGDGDRDVVILQSRYEPFYGGNYLQYLSNDGRGNFTDETTARFGDPTKSPDTFGQRLQWTDAWQLIDINRDGMPDIVGQHAVSRQPFYYLNSARGYFSQTEIVGPDGFPVAWGDLSNDGALEALVFRSTWNDSSGGSSTNRFELYTLAKQEPPAASRAFDVTGGNAGVVAKTLGAVFGANSVKNQTYVGIGLSMVDGGMTYERLLDAALNIALGENRSNEAVVSLLFSNLVGRSPTANETSSYVQLISSGQFTQVSLAHFAADSELNATNIDLIGISKAGLDYVPAG